jgi:hypothetical protein
LIGRQRASLDVQTYAAAHLYQEGGDYKVSPLRRENGLAASRSYRGDRNESLNAGGAYSSADK